MKIVVSEFMDETALSGFSNEDQVLYAPGLVDDRGALLGELADADALIVRNRTQVNQELLDAAPNLQVVGRLGVGLDNIDLDTCASRQVAVCPATGANTLSVAEYVITAALVLVRGAYHSAAEMQAGDWPRNALIGGEVSGRCLGLWGFGGIARAVAVRAQALGMTIAAYDPFVAADDPVWSGIQRCESGDELLQQSDVLSLHVPLTDSTRNLIDAAAIAKMPAGAVLINTARGGVVDETAVAEALRSEALGGAALDVFESEPLTEDAASRFKDVPNLILTPHIAGVTKEGNVRVSSVTVENVKRVLNHG
ncbi:hydroxyacid dehydrogenase [Roseibium sp.]|uniref:hydroxyacid dehydrogenase n=1 Tax=Roseibium sp. TaxID=1936156 RepID=UPI003B524375